MELVGPPDEDGMASEAWASDLLVSELESLSLAPDSASQATFLPSSASHATSYSNGGFSGAAARSSAANVASDTLFSGGNSKPNSEAQLLKLESLGERTYFLPETSTHASVSGGAAASGSVPSSSLGPAPSSLYSIISTQELHPAASSSVQLFSQQDTAPGTHLSAQLFSNEGLATDGYLEPPNRLRGRSNPLPKVEGSSNSAAYLETGHGHSDSLAGTSSSVEAAYASPRSAAGGGNGAGGPAGPSGGPGPAGGGRGDKGQRGQGYRKLWQQVTKVGKGQKLKDSVNSQSDVTVEDLVRLVMKLAPQESAVHAVEQGLYYLDSSALAALLKELAKQGHLRRSVEIFDWLRGLEPGHELHHLCDLYTYTTMISQCGSHQQLRRALELVAEMRSKGITCNVHTYSALMNVCIKANELELAQDVFDQMLEEGCTPNLVTYNILIDVHVKNGQWEEAVARLDTLERQGIQAEVRTYNTVISACNKSGQPEQALKIYDRMLAAGLKPSATTYTALISAYGKRGMVDKAMEIYQDMIRRGCERNVITYSSLISACEKAGQWELAMDLFGKMHREGCKPNVVTYNSLIAACAHGGPWEKAAELFDQMQKEGCKPDGITFAALISAYEKGGQWRRGLQALEHMQAQGCHPDAAVFNSLMDVLWQSGVILAQVRALQLWSLANRNGQFRIYINSRSSADYLQYSTLAFTNGAIYVTVLRWLAELRNKLVKDGPAFFRSHISLSLHKSKQASRVADTSTTTQECLAAMLQGAGSPLKVQTADNAVVVEAPSGELIAWLRTPEFAELVFLTQGANLKKLTLEVLFAEDIALSTRCVEAFAAVRRVEDSHVMNLAFYNPAVLQQRQQVVHLALKYVGSFGFKGDAMYDGLQLFDKVQCSGMSLNANLWPLVLCVTVLLAGRQTDRDVPWPSYEQIALLTGFGPEAVSQMERTCLVALRSDLGCISVLRVLQLCLERLGFYMQGELGHFKLADHVTKDMHALLVKVACSPITIGVRPSMVAAATLVVLRKLKGTVPFWPMALQLMSGYALHPGSDLHTCVMHIEGLLAS